MRQAPADPGPRDAGSASDARVVFHGAGHGHGDLTWGQRAIWEAMRWLGDANHYFNFAHVFPVPAGRRMAGVRAAVSGLMERHESLRTRFPGYPDDPRQRLHRTGTLDLAVHDCGDAPQPAEVDDAAAGLCARLRGHAFRHEREWPLRAGVVRHGGEPARLVLVVSHLVVDGAGWRLLTAEVADLLAGDGPGADRRGDAGLGPLALTRLEADESGARANAAALRHWRAVLSVVPHSVFDLPETPPERPRYVGLNLQSTALAVAADHLATRLRSTTSIVLLTALVALLGQFTGHEEMTLQLIVGNRWRRELRDVVAPLTQNGIFVASCGGATFADAVRNTWQPALDCYRAGSYDPRDLSALLAEMRLRRGAHLDREAFFNDARAHDRWPALPAVDPSPQRLLRLCADTRLAVTDRWERLGIKAFWYLRPSPDRAVIDLQADTAYLPTRDARLLLKGIETLVVRAVHAPVMLADLGGLTGVRPVRRGPDWVRIGPDWVRPAAVEEILAASPRLAAATVCVDDRAAPRLVAYAVPRDPELAVEDLHQELCAALGERTDVTTPGWYVLCADAPRALRSQAAWRDRPVLRSGTGRPPHGRPLGRSAASW
jgi:hypothetical protein